MTPDQLRELATWHDERGQSCLYEHERRQHQNTAGFIRQCLQSHAHRCTSRTTGEMTMKFRKKPVVIEAYRLPSAGEDVPHSFYEWVDEVGFSQWESDRDEGLLIKTLEGVMRADPGDWIIKGVAGEFYPCKPDIFAATYEPVSDDAPAAPQAEPLDDDEISKLAWQQNLWTDGMIEFSFLSFARAVEQAHGIGGSDE